MKNLIFSILVVQVCFLNGCKKYPDGPLISFYSATNRITGMWYFKHVLANNVDMIKIFSCDTCNCNQVEFNHDSDGDSFGIGPDCNFAWHGLWDIPNREKEFCLEVIGGETLSFLPWLEKGKKTCWRIRRLTQHEFWITCDYQGIHYEINWHK